ncbi:MAG: phytanoyl-CoA dioxygenase family protein [Planctomycetota bacterium]
MTVAEPATAARVAPPGFTHDQWAQFMEDGFLVIEDAITPEEVDRYVETIERHAEERGLVEPGLSVAPQNIVEWDPLFAELIDHPRHIGYAYDLYGEQTKLQQSQFMLRPRGGSHNIWHPDGARALPYPVFSPVLPLQLKFGYWLTDLPERRMGNFVCVPGSHTTQYQPYYDTHDDVPGQQILKCKAGTMTLMHNALWHRVDPNESDVVRKNLFYTYSPAWVCNQDRWHSDPNWLAEQTRERRILMRSYGPPYDCAKPPASEFPLYLDRDTASDRDEGVYPAHVQLLRRKRLTFAEKMMGLPHDRPGGERPTLRDND